MIADDPGHPFLEGPFVLQEFFWGRGAQFAPVIQSVPEDFMIDGDNRPQDTLVDRFRGKVMASIYSVFEEAVRIDTGLGTVHGTLGVPERAWGAVILADGTGRAQYHPQGESIAASLQDLGIATLVIDLLTTDEEDSDESVSRRRLDFRLLTERLNVATDWIKQHCECAGQDFRIGYVGASLGAIAALRAAADRPDIAAVMSCGGRPDWAGEALPRVGAATLMVVGELDLTMIESNYAAYDQLTHAYRREVALIPQVTDLFDEPAALDQVSLLASRWFVRYLGAAANRRQPHQRSLGVSPN